MSQDPQHIVGSSLHSGVFLVAAVAGGSGCESESMRELAPRERA